MKTDVVMCFHCNPFPAFISSGRVVYEPEDKHPERIFPAFVAMFIEEGILYFKEGDVQYTLTPGQWFIQTPGIRHYGYKASGVRTVFHYIHFLPQEKWYITHRIPNREQAASRIKQLESGQGIAIPRYEIELPMQGIFPFSDWKEMLDRLEQKQIFGSGAIGKQACFLELLERMVRLESEKEIRNTPVKKVIAYIQQHYCEPLTVLELARLFHFSPDYLTRQIKRAIGITPSVLIIQLRMNKAKNLLVYTNNSIQQISLAVGYQDIEVFSRMFKKQNGISPTKYRQEQFGRDGLE